MIYAPWISSRQSSACLPRTFSVPSVLILAKIRQALPDEKERSPLLFFVTHIPRHPHPACLFKHQRCYSYVHIARFPIISIPLLAICHHNETAVLKPINSCLDICSILFLLVLHMKYLLSISSFSYKRPIPCPQTSNHASTIQPQNNLPNQQSNQQQNQLQDQQ